MRLGALIRAYRNQHRYGVREMAKLIGISPATLSRIENGKPCDSNTAFRVVLWALEPAAHDERSSHEDRWNEACN